MSDRYNQPERGTMDWGEILNENFREIGADVDEHEEILDVLEGDVQTLEGDIDELHDGVIGDTADQVVTVNLPEPASGSSDLTLFIGGTWVGTDDPSVEYPDIVEDSHTWVSPDDDGSGGDSGGSGGSGSSGGYWTFDKEVTVTTQSSVTVDLSDSDYEKYRLEFIDFRADTDHTDLWLRVNGNTDSRYDYQTLGDGHTSYRLTTEVLVSNILRETPSQPMNGFIDIYTEGRIRLFGNLSSGFGIDDPTLKRAQHRDESDTVDTVSLYTGDGANLASISQIYVYGHNPGE